MDDIRDEFTVRGDEVTFIEEVGVGTGNVQHAGDGSSSDRNQNEVGAADERGEESSDNSSNTEEESDAEYTTKRKRKEPAPVWSCGAIKVKGGAKCTLCGKVFHSKTKNTSNITKHILQKHTKKEESKRLKKAREEKEKNKKAKEASKLEEAKSKKQLAQTSLFNFVSKAPPIDVLKKKKQDQAIVKHIILQN